MALPSGPRPRMRRALCPCVHVPSFAANERFIGLDLARQLATVLVLHRKADSSEHEPSGFCETPMSRPSS